MAETTATIPAQTIAAGTISIPATIQYGEVEIPVTQTVIDPTRNPHVGSVKHVTDNRGKALRFTFPVDPAVPGSDAITRDANPILKQHFRLLDEAGAHYKITVKKSVERVLTEDGKKVEAIAVTFWAVERRGRKPSVAVPAPAGETK